MQKAVSVVALAVSLGPYPTAITPRWLTWSRLVEPSCLLDDGIQNLAKNFPLYRLFNNKNHNRWKKAY
ncbi:MAG TPA: hypothetical protein PK147_03760 [Saprospiraceae bacterium]|nr:hypothetical protein [Saprospiraceae bacterium]HPQ20939.1 hypothetical protein [Saprospiraceae bacterium]HRX29842.1 hypothetical protein [Saprospiraceae bacterium]